MATKFSCGRIKLSPFDATEKVHKTFTTEYVAYKPLQRKGRSQHWKNHPPSKLMRSRWIVSYDGNIVMIVKQTFGLVSKGFNLQKPRATYTSQNGVFTERVR